MIKSSLLIGAAAVFWSTAAGAGGSAPAGQTLFAGRCAACHSVVLLNPKATAPTLAGVVGRKAGALAGARYSPALAKADLVWTPANLDRYLANPSAVVPGTRMLVKLAKPQDRANVIAYLTTLSGTPAK